MKSTLRRRKSMASKYPARVVFEGELEIPPITNLAEFRDWARSDEFPERGRIDYVDGSIEVDMAPEALDSHGSPKVEIVSVIHHRLKLRKIGKVFVDRMRLTCVDIGFSAEPDVLFVSYASIEAGRVRLIRSRAKPSEYMEVEGAADLVVEIVSRGSVAKDTRHLPVKYFAAGVREYWLVDARGDDIDFQILRRGRSAFVRTRKNAQGFLRSQVLDASFRLNRHRDALGLWEYELAEVDDQASR